MKPVCQREQSNHAIQRIGGIMSYLMRRISVFIVVVLLASCSATTFHVGSDFDVNQFAVKVERGVTSSAQVRTWLGAPSGTGVRVETDGQRFDEWTYYFAAGNMSNVSATRLKTLQIKLDGRGIVQGYNWSTDH
jgi:outer membrane protein assembly factor BamE (lipoprotein component of BamABCDE complex)